MPPSDKKMSIGKVGRDNRMTIVKVGRDTKNPVEVGKPDECSICKETLNNEADAIKILDKKDECGHMFHEKCIGEWYNHNRREIGQLNATCPLCRKGFTLDDPEDQELIAIHPELQAARVEAERLEILVTRAANEVREAERQTLEEAGAERTAIQARTKARVELKEAKRRGQNITVAEKVAARAESQAISAGDIAIQAALALGVLEDHFRALKEQQEVHLELLRELEAREEAARRAEINQLGDAASLNFGSLRDFFRGGSTRRGRRSKSRRSKSKRSKKSKKSKKSKRNRGKTRR